jgi:transposase
MESTSVYWIPIFELLDARGFTVFLVNARDAKHVPGRKTDVSDAQWLQRLHSYGLLRASFRPKGQIAELRAYVRQRERLLEYAASHIQHMQKALTEMNLQLHHVVPTSPARRVCGSAGARPLRRLPREGICSLDRLRTSVAPVIAQAREHLGVTARSARRCRADIEGESPT